MARYFCGSVQSRNIDSMPQISPAAMQFAAGLNIYGSLREPLNKSSPAGRRIFCRQLLPILSELP